MTAKKKKTGRPLIPIDPKIVEGMASVGATNREIGDFVGCSDDTVWRRFKDILVKSRASMRTRLRQAQFKTALGGNPALLIWLGKNMLDQKDRQSLDVATPGGPLQVAVTHRVVQVPTVSAARRAVIDALAADNGDGNGKHP